MVDRIPAALVLVGQPFPQTVDVTAATLKRQVAEHVVEGAVLHHQDDDVVDLLKVGPTGLLRHDTSRSYHSQSVPNYPMTAANTANTVISVLPLSSPTSPAVFAVSEGVSSCERGDKPWPAATASVPISAQRLTGPCSTSGWQYRLGAASYWPTFPYPACRLPLTWLACNITVLHPVSASAFGHLLLRVGDRALQRLHMVALRLADDLFDRAGHGGFDFAGGRVRVGEYQARAADGYGLPRLLFELAGGPVVQEPAACGAERGADRGSGEQGWCEQSHRESDRAQARCAFADHVVGLLHRQFAVEVLAHHDRAVQVPAAPEGRLVVLLSGVLRHVTADQDV